MTEKQIKEKAIYSLKQNDWLYWFPPKVKYFKETDIFGIFDCVCIDRKSGEIHFVQITELSHLSHRRTKILSYFKEHNVFVPNAWVWAWDKKNQVFFKVKIGTFDIVHAPPTPIQSA